MGRPTWCPDMSIDLKIRIGLLLVSLAISAFAALAAAHGIHVGFLDATGPGSHSPSASP